MQLGWDCSQAHLLSQMFSVHVTTHRSRSCPTVQRLRAGTNVVQVHANLSGPPQVLKRGR